MIVDPILDLVFGVAQAVVDLLPESTLDLSGLSEGAGYLSWVGTLFDVSAIAAALAFIVAVEVSLAGLRVALFVWRLTPFSG